MPPSTECICCKEIATIVSKIGEAIGDDPVTCITEHLGFEGVCLNVWVLQVAYYQYRQEHGSSSSPPSLHEYGCTCNIALSIPINYVQEIQIYCLSAANKVVLGLAGSKCQSDTTCLCCEEN